MNALDTSSSQSPTASQDASKRFSAVRLPIEEPIDDLEDAVETLKSCSSAELQRAREHHRRAIESLQEGGYNALSDDTRDDLIAHLRSNLKVLNQALDATASSSTDSMPADPEEDSNSFFGRVRALVQGIW